MSAEQRRRLVEHALRDRQWEFRTLEGLSEATGVPIGEIKEIVESGGIARRPWNRPDLDLFAPPDRPVSWREVLSFLRLCVSKRV